MTLDEILEVVAPLNEKRRLYWLHELGWSMTVSARAGYPAAQQADSISHLMAFNELQHQLFNYLRDFEAGKDWGIEQFVRALYQRAVSSGVEGDFGRALKRSVGQISE